jgi:L-histidine N-alpha-methyltransferase
MLLDAFTATGQLTRFVPVDVSEGTLRSAARGLSVAYPGLQVEALVGDFTLHLAHLPRCDSPHGRRLVAFLGGTIGNLYVEERAAFLGALTDSLEPGDWVLLGTDLVKSADRLIAAYDDPQGISEAFVVNCLRVVNAALGANFDPDAYTYVPFWDPRMERMDLRLRAEVPQEVSIPGAGLSFEVACGEEIRVEISTKFRPEGIRAELGEAGLAVRRMWTDPQGDFAITLAERC